MNRSWSTRPVALWGAVLLLVGVGSTADAAAGSPSQIRCEAAVLPGGHDASGRCQNQGGSSNGLSYYTVATFCGACTCSQTAGKVANWPNWANVYGGALWASDPFTRTVPNKDAGQPGPGETRQLPGSKC